MARNHDIIVKAPQQGAQKTKLFANLTFGLVSFDGRAPGFQGDAEPEMANIIRNTKNRALRKSNDLTIGKEALVLPRVVES